VSHTAQLSATVVVLALGLKLPDPQAAHSRSLLTVAATVVRKPASHGALTALHTLSSLTSEYVEPPSQASQTRSALAEPENSKPWPIGQVAHAVQAIRPALAANAPAVQSSHVRSLLAVASAVVYLPAMHGLLTPSHVAVPPAAVNVTPTWHDVQLLSAMAVPAE
jgi:hypothetical protein